MAVGELRRRLKRGAAVRKSCRNPTALPADSQTRSRRWSTGSRTPRTRRPARRRCARRLRPRRLAEPHDASVGATATYGYKARGHPAKLSTAKAAVRTPAYRYDAPGNLTSKTSDAAATRSRTCTRGRSPPAAGVGGAGRSDEHLHLRLPGRRIVRYVAAAGDDAFFGWDGPGGLPPGRIAMGAAAADPVPRSSTRTPTTWVRRRR